jgi:hypothetical protein
VVSPGILLVTCCAINTLKSGELRNRVLLLAKEIGITLQRVFIVPSRKGHLTNAFGMSSAIGLTDNLGKYLTKEQVHSLESRLSPWADTCQQNAPQAPSWTNGQVTLQRLAAGDYC